MLPYSTTSTLLFLLLLFSLLISGSPSVFGVLSSMSSMISPFGQHEGEINMGTQSALEILALATNHLTDGIKSTEQPYRPFITISYAQTIDGSMYDTTTFKSVTCIFFILSAHLLPLYSLRTYFHCCLPSRLMIIRICINEQRPNVTESIGYIVSVVI